MYTRNGTISMVNTIYEKNLKTRRKSKFPLETKETAGKQKQRKTVKGDQIIII